MKRETFVVYALAIALLLFPGLTSAADQGPAHETAQTQKEEQIYGSQLMTQEERTEYHAKMRAAKTAEEREQIREEHHERMKDRAKERGVTLPDEPCDRGSGSGMGSGGGMGRGAGGMGSGGGRNR
jgi:hypothetical protein